MTTALKASDAIAVSANFALQTARLLRLFILFL